jgi:DNA-binding NtrC family response regulator
MRLLNTAELSTPPAKVDNWRMIRPCFLVIDREYSGSISTRKLVIETAKFNVITSYSAEEALETLGRFPNVDGIVLDGGVRDLSCCELIKKIKALNTELPVITICAPGTHDCDDADYHLESFDPARLLNILRKLKPDAAAAIEARNEDLSGKY